MLLCMAALMGACAVPARYMVSVSSISAPEAQSHKSYVLLPGNAGMRSDDLEFRQYAGMLETALRPLGFTKAPSETEANVAIVFAYGIDNGRDQQVHTAVPIYGPTGVSSSYTTGNVSRAGNYSATTTYTPSYGITGFVPQSHTVTVFTRKAIIGAYEAPPPKAGEPKPLWRTTIVSSGSSPDLRKVMPYMLRAAAPYLGTDTGQALSVTINEDPPSEK